MTTMHVIANEAHISKNEAIEWATKFANRIDDEINDDEIMAIIGFNTKTQAMMLLDINSDNIKNTAIDNEDDAIVASFVLSLLTLMKYPKLIDADEFDQLSEIRGKILERAVMVSSNGAFVHDEGESIN